MVMVMARPVTVVLYGAGGDGNVGVSGGGSASDGEGDADGEYGDGEYGDGEGDGEKEMVMGMVRHDGIIVSGDAYIEQGIMYGLNDNLSGMVPICDRRCASPGNPSMMSLSFGYAQLKQFMMDGDGLIVEWSQVKQTIVVR